MRHVCFLLFLVLIPTLSWSQNSSSTNSLEECRLKLKQIVGAGLDTPSNVDENFGALLECLEALEKLSIGNNSAVNEAAENSATARAEAGKVTEFDGRVSKLEWDPAGVLGQLQAQAACIGVSGGLKGWITAVPRQCNNQTVSCTQICAGIHTTSLDEQIRGASARQCFNALHVYPNEESSSSGVPGFKTYKYQSCGNTNCGPNYCCCLSAG